MIRREDLPALRRAAGLHTQGALAERCAELAGGSVTGWVAAINRWENGARVPNADQRAIIALALGRVAALPHIPADQVFAAAQFRAWAQLLERQR